jgi:hypothetical protein
MGNYKKGRKIDRNGAIEPSVRGGGLGILPRELVFAKFF